MLSKSGEITERLNRLAHILGNRLFGVDIGVDESGDRLIFCDEDDEPIMWDGEELVAVTLEEIEKNEIGEFYVRALRAAGFAKYIEIEKSRAP